MTPEEHRVLRESLGALALGHLPDAERAAAERHLRGCAACRADLAEIGALGDRLRAVDWRRLAAATTPPPALGERVLAAVAAERRQQAVRRTGSRAVGAVAAAAAVVAVGGLGAVAGRGSVPRVTAARGPLEVVAVRSSVPGVEASAGVVPHTWGVEIKLRAAGFEPGAAYAVHVTTADGRRRPAGAFVGTGAKTMDCNLNSDVLRPDAASFAVVDAAGRTVLAATLPKV